jgi:ABC-type lipopolysaccharide export system ATPase subunit
LLDLPDELILAILKKVNPQALLLCSMIDIGNNRLKQLVFDRCNSIDLTFDYLQAPHELLFNRFYSHVMPRIIHDIQSLTINLHQISSIITSVENNCNGTLRNLTHLKIMLGAKLSRTGTPYTIGNV